MAVSGSCLNVFNQEHRSEASISIRVSAAQSACSSSKGKAIFSFSSTSSIVQKQLSCVLPSYFEATTMSSPTSPYNPYAAAHASPQGEGDARPTGLQIIHDEGLTNKLTDKVMLVTGSSSGIGVETVRALHATGAHIFMQVRDMEKGSAVQKEILASSEGNGKLELLYMELGSFESIRKGVKEFLEKSGGKLNVLINNAGMPFPSQS